MTARFLVGDVFEQLATLPDDSVDLVLTSPPFLALRSYLPADHPDKGKEIGSEATPADFLDTLLDVVEACARVLGPYGSLVFELGDTYAGSGGGGGDYLEGGLREGQPGFGGSAERQREGNAAAHWRAKNQQRDAWPLDKSLCGIPTLFAWSLAYGRNLLRPERSTDPWRIRNVVAWCRPNPPVGALGDKFRPGTSYLTVACKARDRWFDLDAVREAPTAPMGKVVEGNTSREFTRPNVPLHDGTEESVRFARRVDSNPAGAPPLDWWEIPTQPYKGAHYATFPERLVERPIKAMCPTFVCTECGEPRRRITETTVRDRFGEARPSGSGFNEPEARRAEQGHTSLDVQTLGWSDCGHNTWRRGIVLDPFAGSGTTLAVAEGLGRDSIGIDLDARNADLASARCGMFLTVEISDREAAS